MPSHAEFLADIIAHRDEDGPRLVYADWLEEHGEPERGELIRVQCELARLPDVRREEPPTTRRQKEMAVVGPTYVLPSNLYSVPLTLEQSQEVARVCDRREALERRAGELLGMMVQEPEGFHSSNRVRWSRPVCEAAGGQLADYPIFRRGFVAAITCTAETWLGGVCQRCGGDGRPNSGDDWERENGDCDCDGTGRTPGHADALLAATPLEVVRLTTEPGGRPWEMSTLEWLKSRWPGIRFELPPASNQVIPMVITEAQRNILEALGDDVSGYHVVPD